MHDKFWRIVLILALAVGSAIGQVTEEADDETESTFERLRRQAGQMIDGLRQFDDWETHYQYQINAVEDIYDQNGWDSEADLFSLELMREVEQIPPWEVQERFTTVFGVISDRYLLDEGQERTLRRLIFEENRRLFSTHSGRIMEYALEAIQTRVAGEPFTSEQVARWTKLAEPVFLDSRKGFERAAEKFMDVLEPEQQELVQADIDAANRRMDSIQQLAAGWKRGEWKASDWGLANDPIQNAAALEEQGANETVSTPNETKPVSPQELAQMERDRAAREREESEVARRAGERDREEHSPPPPPEREPNERKTAKDKEPNDEWAQYVRKFITAYQLTDDQQQKAWLFYQDARKRADTTAKQIARVSGEDASDPRTKARLDAAKKKVARDHARLFERLKARLDGLPTRTQRRGADTKLLKGKDKKKKP